MKKFFNWWKTQSIVKKLLYLFTISLTCLLIVTIELIPSSINNSFPPLQMLIVITYVVGFPWFCNILLYKVIFKKLNLKNRKIISWVLFIIGWSVIGSGNIFGKQSDPIFLQILPSLTILVGFSSMFFLMINGFLGKLFIGGTIGEEGLEKLKDRLYKN